MVFGYVIYLGLLVGSVLGVAVGLLELKEGFRRWREFNALEDVPVASLDAVAVGETAVTGTVEADEPPVTVPVGDERCVCYDLAVEDSTDVLPVHEERESVPFFVSDGVGRVRVDPSDFRLDLTDDRTESFEFKSYDEVPERAAAFHESRDLPARGMRRDRTVEYAYLRPGDEVYAYGRARPDPERAAGPDEKALVLEAGEAGFLSDRSRAALRRERRFALAKSAAWGAAVATVGLAGVLWLSGFAQLFLGA